MNRKLIASASAVPDADQVQDAQDARAAFDLVLDAWCNAKGPHETQALKTVNAVLDNLFDAEAAARPVCPGRLQ